MKSYSEFYNNKKINVWLDITTNCNAACPQCHRTNPKTLKKWKWLPFIQWSLEEFKIAFPIKTLAHIDKLNFCGSLGDTIMCKDIFEICEYIIKESECYIIINTNGSIRTEFWWQHLGYIIGYDRGHMIFDIDGSTQEMHEFYRQKTNLDKIIKNMKAYSLYGHAGTFTVVFKHNENHLKEIHKMVDDIIGEHYHVFVPTDRVHHLNKFEFYKDGESQFLEHSKKYGLSPQRTHLEIQDL